MRHDYPCIHEIRDIKPEVPHSDYHVLDREEIAYLLRIAKESTDMQERASIQGRLIQGIFDIECPTQASATTVGCIAEQANRLYIDNHYRGGDPKLVEQFYNLLHWKESNS